MLTFCGLFVAASGTLVFCCVAFASSTCRGFGFVLADEKVIHWSECIDSQDHLLSKRVDYAVTAEIRLTLH